MAERRKSLKIQTKGGARKVGRKDMEVGLRKELVYVSQERQNKESRKESEGECFMKYDYPT